MVKTADGRFVRNAAIELVITDPATDAAFWLDERTPAADPHRMVVATDDTCIAVARFVAGAQAGSFNIQATALADRNVGELAYVTVAQRAADRFDAPSATSAAHVNAAFSVPASIVVLAGQAPVADVPVTFTVPQGGASATFAGGATSATVATNASGKAAAPPLIANGQVGTFRAAVTAPNVGAASVGPFIVGDTASIAIVPPAGAIGVRPGDFFARVTFPGLPCGMEPPSGSVRFVLDGEAACTYRYQFDPSCPVGAYSYFAHVGRLPLGEHELVAEFAGAPVYADARSTPVHVRQRGPHDVVRHPRRQLAETRQHAGAQRRGFPGLALSRARPLMARCGLRRGEARRRTDGHGLPDLPVAAVDAVHLRGGRRRRGALEIPLPQAVVIVG